MVSFPLLIYFFYLFFYLVLKRLKRHTMCQLQMQIFLGHKFTHKWTIFFHIMRSYAIVSIYTTEYTPTFYTYSTPHRHVNNIPLWELYSLDAEYVEYSHLYDEHFHVAYHERTKYNICEVIVYTIICMTLSLWKLILRFSFLVPLNTQWKKK